MHLHEKLKITFQELMALFAVRTMLQHNLITFHPDYEKDPGPREHGFNMAVSCDRHRCGSVGCIGGYMGMVMGQEGAHYVASKSTVFGGGGRSHPIHDLFFPPNGLDWNTIKPKHAVQAIDNFLKTGDPDWYAIDGIEEDEEGQRGG